MRIALAILISLAIAIATTIHAEVPLLRPAEQQQLARHIVTGKVLNVYTSERVLNKNHVDTLFAVEVAVTGVVKGDGIEAGHVIFAKAWQMKKRARGWAGPSGQAAIPKPGQVVKLFLTGDHGAFDALSPNGVTFQEVD